MNMMKMEQSKKDAADNPIVATRPTIADIFYSEYLLDLSEAEKQALAAGDSYDLPLSEYFDFTEPYPTGTIADADVATDIDGTVGNWSVVKDNATGTFNLHVAFTKPLTGITNITSDIAFSANINRVQVSAPQDIKIFHPINNGVELFATRIFGNPSPLEVRSTKTAVDANNFTWTLDYNKGYDVIAANTATPIVEVADTNEVFTNITLYALQLDVDGNEIAQPTELEFTSTTGDGLNTLATFIDIDGTTKQVTLNVTEDWKQISVTFNDTINHPYRIAYTSHNHHRKELHDIFSDNAILGFFEHDDEGNLIVDANGNYTKIEKPTLNDRFHAEFKFAFTPEAKNTIVPGDFYEVAIPDIFDFGAILPSGDLEIEGVKLAHWEVTPGPNSVLRVTFNTSLKDMEEIEGDIQFQALLNKDKVNHPGTIKVPKPFNESEFFEFHIFSEDQNGQIAKEGLIPPQNPTHLTWFIDVNKGYEYLNNPLITDMLPTGLSIEDVEKIQIFELDVQHDGTAVVGSVLHKNASGNYVFEDKNGQEQTITLDITTDPTKPTVQFNGEIKRPYRIQYVTKIEENGKPSGKDNEFTYNNNVTLTVGGTEFTANKSLTATWDKALTKSMNGYVGDEKEAIAWQINYNTRGEAIPQDQAWMEDKWSSTGIPMELDDADNFKNFKVYAGEVAEANLLIKDVDYEITYLVPGDKQSGFKVQFLQDIYTKMIVSYHTKTVGIVFDNITYTNTVASDIFGTTPGINGYVTQNMLTKNHVATDVVNQTIEWIINVNHRGHQIQDAKITDTYPYKGLIATDNDIVVTDITANKILQQDVDYMLDNKGVNGFELSLIGDYASTTHKLRINTKTKYNVDKLDPRAFERNASVNATTPSYNTATILNNAKLSWINPTTGNTHTSTDGAYSLVAKQISNNGAKSGIYNPQTKVITWKIHTNFHNEMLNDAKLTDTFSEGQKFAGFNSVKIRKYQVTPINTSNPDALEKFVITELDDIDLAAWSGQITFDEVTKTLNINFPDSIVAEDRNDRYVITFETTLDEKRKIEAKETNRAISTNTGAPDRTFDAVVEIPFGSKFASKSGKLREGSNPLIIDWEVRINESQSSIHEAEITDILTANHEYLKDNDGAFLHDNIKIYPIINVTPENPRGEVDEANPLVEGTEIGQYRLSFEQPTDPDALADDDEAEKFIVKFNGDADKDIKIPYVIRYATKLTPKSAKQGNHEFNNKLNIVGFDATYEDDNGDKSVPLNLLRHRGRISWKTTGLKLQKVDLDGNPLNGVVFELIGIDTSDPTNTIIEKQQATTATINNETGIIEFKNLRYTSEHYQYRLVEVTPLPGYVIEDEYKGQGKQIEIPYVNQQDPNKKVLTVQNRKSKLEIIKVGENDEPLEGAEFKIQTSEGIDVPGGENLKLINDTIMMEGLPFGTYHLYETKVPEGYIHRTTPYIIDFQPNKFDEPIDLTYRAINYKGSVELTKTNTAGTGLAGAEFTLYQKILGESDKVIATKVTTAANGKVRVDNLEPGGTYYFLETKAPAGYILETNKKTPDFIIPTETTETTKPVVQLTALQNYQGAAMLSKVQEDGATPLAGAEFGVYNAANNQLVKAGILSDAMGIIKATGLAPGNYYFQEIKAPTGYITNTTKRAFTIPSEVNPTTSVFDGTNYVITVKDATDSTKDAIVINYQGKIELTKNARVKIAENNYQIQPLPDVVYRVFTENNTPVQASTTFKTDASGKILIEKLAPGKYYLQEVSSNKGYLTNLIKIDFEIGTAADEKPETITKTALNQKGKVEFTKNFDGTNKTGAVFEFYRKKMGTEPNDTLLLSNLEPVSGKIIIDDLEPGNYYFKEIATNADHIPYTGQVEVVIPANYTGASTETQFVRAASLTNYQGRVALNKYPGTGNQRLVATFELYKEKSGTETQDKKLVILTQLGQVE